MEKKHFRLLRFLLWASAFGWGVSIIGVFLPWNLALKGLIGLGMKSIPLDPMPKYWFRMAAAAFSVIGALFAVSALNPRKYQVIIPLLGWMNIFEGLVLLTYGLMLGLKPFPFWGDAGFCLFTGIGIIWLCHISNTEREIQ